MLSILVLFLLRFLVGALPTQGVDCTVRGVGGQNRPGGGTTTTTTTTTTITTTTTRPGQNTTTTTITTTTTQPGQNTTTTTITTTTTRPGQNSTSVTTTTTTTTITTTTATPTCGLRRGQRIIGGSRTTIEDFPWHIILRPARFLCGAVLISQNLALTAGHCTDGIPEEDISLFLGCTFRLEDFPETPKTGFIYLLLAHLVI